MLQRNLLYTGVTRGKRLAILLGQKKAVAMGGEEYVRSAAMVETEGVAAIATFLREQVAAGLSERSRMMVVASACLEGIER